MIKKLLILIITCSLIFANIGGVGMAQDINPKPLLKGATAPHNGLFFTEEEYVEILKIGYNYKIDKKAWKEKEEIYQKALKKAGKVPFFKSFKCGFIVGMGLIILSVWAVGQLND